MGTPSQQIVSAASAVLTVCDDTGRTLTLKRLGALDRLRLFKVVGPELAENPPYLGIAMLAVSVTAVDGVPVPFPATEGQLEGLVQRLGDSGIQAVAQCLTDAAGSETESTDMGN
jgi:hypothetical protein